MEEISREIVDILQCHIDATIIPTILHKLIGYQYVTCPEKGRYIRWISLSKKTVLTNGGIVLDIKDSNYIICKNNIGKIIQLTMNNSIVFQKMTDNELLILNAKQLLLHITTTSS